MSKLTQKIVIVSLVTAAAIGAGIWALVWQGTHKNQQALESALPGYGEPLQSDGLSANLGNSASAPSPDELKKYEQYRSEKTVLTGDIQKGSGAEATNGTLVNIAYKGYLTTGQLFSQTTGRLLAFKLGDRGIIPGLQMGVAGMKAGGKRRIIIPPALGYGDKAHEQVPPNSILVFDIELVAVKNPD